MLELYWGEDEVRSGWFLKVPEEKRPRWVHGPSICTSSGGGAMEALSIVLAMIDGGPFQDAIILITTQPHCRWDDGACNVPCTDPVCLGTVDTSRKITKDFDIVHG